MLGQVGDNDLAGQSSGNYSYDAIGNLTSDLSENIDDIQWTVDGKIPSISRNGGSLPKLFFQYDPMGNRIRKSALDINNPIDNKYFYYQRDASGNTMAVYKLSFEEVTVEGEDGLFNTETHATFTLSEHSIYGSSRLGVDKTDEVIAEFILDQNVDLLNPPKAITTAMSPEEIGFTYLRTMDQKQYELANHLGNVLATVSDRKLGQADVGGGQTTPDNAEYYTSKVISAQDYYPFGMVKKHPENLSNDNYRYGFNGMESDDEIKGEKNSLDFGARIYDPRIGRWMSVDPLQKKYPASSPYSFVLNTPIQAVDPDGRVVVWANDLQSQIMKKQVMKLVEESDVFRAIYEQLDVLPYNINVSVNDEVIDDLMKDEKNLTEKDKKGALGVYMIEDREIVFRETANDEVIAEEFSHALQYLYYDKPSSPNLESEAKLLNATVVDQTMQENTSDSNGGFSIGVTRTFGGPLKDLVWLIDNIENQKTVETDQEIADYKTYTQGFENYYSRIPDHKYNGPVTQEKPDVYNRVIEKVENNNSDN